MSLAPPLAVRQHYDQRLLRSRAIFRWRADTMKLDALAGQAPVFTRSGTLTADDSLGATATYPQNFPAWGWADSRPEVWVGTPAAGSGGGFFGARYLAARHWSARYFGGEGAGAGTVDDVWYYPWNRAVADFTVLVRVRQRGGMNTAGTGFFYIGAASESGARIWIESNGANYSMRMHNGSTEVGSTLTTAPSDDDEVELRGEFYATGGSYTVRLSADINGGGEETASAASPQAFASHAASSRIYLGSLGGQNGAPVALREVVIARGQLTKNQIEDVF